MAKTVGAAGGLVTVRFDERAMQRLRDLGKDSIEDMVDSAMEEIVKAAQTSDVPGPTVVKGFPTYRAIRRGTLIQSLAYKISGAVAEIFTSCGHGGWVEIGTRKRPATPFIIPGLQNMARKLGGVLKNRLR